MLLILKGTLQFVKFAFETLLPRAARKRRFSAANDNTLCSNGWQYGDSHGKEVAVSTRSI